MTHKSWRVVKTLHNQSINPKGWIFFLYLYENIIYYVVGASNEYPQNMFLWRTKKNIDSFIEKKKKKRKKKSTLSGAMCL